MGHPVGACPVLGNYPVDFLVLFHPLEFTSLPPIFPRRLKRECRRLLLLCTRKISPTLKKREDM